MADDLNQPGGIISVLQNGVRALNNIATVLGKVFPSSGGTSTSATGGSATLPANPVGFLSVVLPDGTTAVIPYYAP